MIVDFHTHVYPPTVPGFWRRPSSTIDLIQAMNRAGVARAGVIAIAPYITNDVVAEAARAYPDRLVPIGSVDPLAAAAIESVDHAVRVLGARAIKVHPRLQGFGLQHLVSVVRVAERCGDLGVPLVICSFQGGPDMFRSRILECCGEVAAAASTTSIVLAHAGGHQPIDTLLLMKAHHNIAVDLSFTPLYYRESSVVQDLEYLVRKADRRRVLFGSDFPEMPIDDSLKYVTNLLDRLHFQDADVEAVLGGNAMRLLAIE